VLDDGTTQLTQFSYNGFGNPAQVIDPVGRETNLAYAANQIDALSVTQQTASSAAAIATFTYNSQHRPLTYTDAAGRKTTCTIIAPDS